MNAKRQKRVYKTIEFYHRNFGFHSPYNILIDGTFCKAALETKINIKEQLPKYLNSEVNIVTTQCIIMEIEKLSKFLKNLYGAWLIVKQFPIHKCGHKKDLKSAASCIKSIIGEKNSNRYIVATMDDDLREHLRTKVLGVPILYLHRQTPTIEKPPSVAEDLVKTEKTSENFELKTLNEIKAKVLGDQEVLTKKRKKRNRDPNPLSCLKSKKQKVEVTTKPSSRKRSRKNKQTDILTSIKNVFDTNNK